MSKETDNTAYLKAYNSLNPKQRQAVDVIDGPVLVIAGPGTGKTQILTTRIANILQSTDTDPSAILALTFTDSGVKAMRERLLSLIGTTAYYVQIYTFHSFCSEVIRSNPDYFLISPDPQPLTDLDRYQIIHDLLDSHHYQYLKPVNAPYHYVKAIISSIQTLKREGITPEVFVDVLTQEKNLYENLLELSKDKKNKISKTKLLEQEKLVNKNKELLEIYQHYQKALSDRGRFDFEDMINFVNKAFTDHPDLLLSYQERLHYFLIDEYQDTNSAQNQIATSLASYWGQQANLFVVGDPNQSIYRFQGASFENMLSFVNTYPAAKVISLEDNYRSTQQILNAAHQVIINNTSDNSLAQASSVKLNSHQELILPLGIANFTSNFAEDYYLASTIKEFLDSGVSASEIAIIFRRNTDIDQLVSVLTRLNVPFQIQGGGDVLYDPQINQLINLLKILAVTLESQEGSDLFVVMNYPFFNLDPLDILRLSRAAAKNKSSIFDLLTSPDFAKGSFVENPNPFLDFVSLISQLQQQSTKLSFPEFLEHLVFKSGYLAHLESRPDSIQKLEDLKVFFDFAFSLYRQNPNLTIKDLVHSIDLMKLNHLSLSKPELKLAQNAVTLTTAHKSKGLEWEYCFLYRVIDGSWGNSSTRELIRLPSGILKYDPKDEDSKQDQNQEERRLFYVALTRAKKQVTITYANHYQNLQSTKEAVPSMFITEIPSDLIVKVDTQKSEKDARNFFGSFFTPISTSKMIEQEESFLKDIINTDFHLSATALTTYLNCPYEFKLKYLIKVPEAPHPAASFGSAIHKALELFYKQYKISLTPPSLEHLINLFENYLNRQPLTDKDKQIRLLQGKDILTAYYNLHQDQFTVPLYTEKWFGGHRPIFLDDISLVGKVDRIDPLNPKAKSVRLVDYKTGQVLSQNHIEGNTAAKDLTYKRQLIFYKLLTTLDPGFRHSVEQVELDFVEAPHREARLAHRLLIISDDDLKEMKDLIRQTMENIRNLKFLRITDTQQCLNCPFKDHCWPDGLPAISSSQLDLFKP